MSSDGQSEKIVFEDGILSESNLVVPGSKFEKIHIAICTGDSDLKKWMNHY